MDHQVCSQITRDISIEVTVRFLTDFFLLSCCLSPDHSFFFCASSCYLIMNARQPKKARLFELTRPRSRPLNRLCKFNRYCLILSCITLGGADVIRHLIYHLSALETCTRPSFVPYALEVQFKELLLVGRLFERLRKVKKKSKLAE